MAVGDAAAAAGMDLVAGSVPANTIDTEINKTRDYIADKTEPIRSASSSSSAAANTLVRRNSDGVFGVPTPTASTHPASKGYVDGLLDAATADATPNTLMRRADGGRVNVGAPVNPSNATTKSYVDSELSQKAEVDTVGQIAAGELDDFVWSNDITGPRRSVWMSSPSGGYTSLGWASSSRSKKQNIRPAELTIEQLRGIPVVLYRYRKAVAAERAGKIDHAATEIGTIAEDVHNLGLWQFVMYEDGKPAGIHYELLGLAALSLAQQLADRLDAIDARLSAAGL